MPLVFFFLSGHPVFPLMLVLKRIAGVEERSRCYTRSLGGWRRATAARSSHSSHRKPHCSSYTVSKERTYFLWDSFRGSRCFKDFPLKIRWLPHLCLQERLVVFTQRAERRLSDVQERLILGKKKNEWIVILLAKAQTWPNYVGASSSPLHPHDVTGTLKREKNQKWEMGGEKNTGLVLILI